MTQIRNLVLVLGDQLDPALSALDGFDAERDLVWMAENATEATHVWCHKKRLVFFLAAMRHYRDHLRGRGLSVSYHQLGVEPADDAGRDFGQCLGQAVARYDPTRLVMTECGDYRVSAMLAAAAAEAGKQLEIRRDRHFYADLAAFSDWAGARKRVVLEDFYRAMRRRHNVLMDGDEPLGGAWNFDKSNRETFGASGPGQLPGTTAFSPDGLTQQVIELVEARFAGHPGPAAPFDLPVTPAQARAALADFIDRRLPGFGAYQDALWTGADFVYHSRLSAALNLHLLDPRDCVDRAVGAYHAGRAPIASVEGFVRQILGWREFVRGIYWHHMPDYIEHNALNADLPVPAAYWHGETTMTCVHEAMRNVRANGYAHHIQRLMVLGLFAQVAGVHPRAFHDWHLAMYIDAIDWASLPNALGMSQFGDGGIVGTKPYCASGNYINKMSNYCKHCRFDYKQASGADACPVTTLYWDFLDRNLARFENNRRMVFQVKNLRRKRADPALMAAIRERAAGLRRRIAAQQRI